jgi:hypothetical protein
MKRKLIVLLAVVALCATFALTRSSLLNNAQAQNAQAGARGGANTDDNEPFKLNGATYINKQAFIESGRRCGTKDHDEIKALQIQERLDRFNATRGAEQGGAKNASAEELSRTAGSVTVNVYVHVIHNGTAVGTGGNISDRMVQRQIDVLNNAFNGTTGGFCDTVPLRARRHDAHE